MIDKYTLATLGFLGLSFLGFFVYRGLEIGIGFAKAINMENTNKLNEIVLWELRNKAALFYTETVFRHISYCLQNLAFLYNIFSFIRKLNSVFVSLFTLIVIVSTVCLIVQLLELMNDFNLLFYPL
jgi:hypothetical protein